MLNKKTLICTIAVFATTMIFGFVVFGMLMADFYAANQGDLTFRPAGEEVMGALTLAEVIIAYAFVWIWGHGVKGEGIKEGLRFGFYMGLFWASVELMNYAFLPMPMNVVIIGFILDIVMFMLAGAVLSVVWGKMEE